METEQANEPWDTSARRTVWVAEAVDHLATKDASALGGLTLLTGDADEGDEEENVLDTRLIEELAIVRSEKGTH